MLLFQFALLSLPIHNLISSKDTSGTPFDKYNFHLQNLFYTFLILSFSITFYNLFFSKINIYANLVFDKKIKNM